MALETYRKKRNFAATPEPEGGPLRAGGNSYLIQKHDARRLHYDFRLEYKGVLLSWAVTRGPSLVPGEKRLAVHVEDHPLEYGNFEGTIPKGEYGGGTVILWDRGTWQPVGDPAKGLKKGHLEFSLDGEKLHGRWHLIRMRMQPGEKRDNWLLIKGDDEFARTEDDPDILTELPFSVKTGRSTKDVAGEDPGWSSKTGRITSDLPDPASLKGAKKSALPDFVPPMLASLMARPPEGARWIHEIKYDGYRLQPRIETGEVRLLTRSGLDWTDRFGPDIIASLKRLPAKTALLDGELVVETRAGSSDFPALQADLSAGETSRFLLYLFDLIYLDGYDLRAVPLVERKSVLERLLSKAAPNLRFSQHLAESGDMVLRHACRLSLEGIVSKVLDSPYKSGRGRNWVKSKCSARQEFVIGGYMPSTVSAGQIGSLLLGVYEGERLIPVGRVGTGFSTDAAREIFRKLAPLKTASSPFDRKLTADEARGAVFVKPDLVAEVEFRAWTADHHLRHASFRGLREDKAAQDIVRETTQAATEEKPPKRRVKLTHPDRLYWPEEGITKEGLADYYAEIWPHIAPFITGRALSLLRCPEGIDGPKFFQKHAWKGISPAVHQVPDPAHPSPKNDPLVSISDLDGLMGLVQAAALEIHPWGSTLKAWEQPDVLILDLDPGEGVPWQAVIDGAVEIRQRLADAGLAAFVKTSGGKGLHVVSPLKPKTDWPAAKAFTKALAEAMAKDHPDRYVATISKAKRKGRILIDYLRNQRGQTAVAPFSPRARQGAAVSTPLDWGELQPAIGPAHFTVLNLPARLSAQTEDPWAGFWKAAKPLPSA